MATITPQELQAKVGEHLGTSDWVLVDQEMINKFADATGDHQFIHIDEEKARLTPFGGTIAHGFLTLSLLSAMAFETVPQLEGAEMGINQGFDTVRF
ncbi:MAG: MaoC family dehydratase, partial [Sphingopyxis sp.]|nr:MaoC family dehydratase [Sphingopyxis sp.]